MEADNSCGQFIRHRMMIMTNAVRGYSGAGEEYFRMQKMHDNLRDVEQLYAKYRMDRFTEHSQVDEMVKKGLLNDTFARNLKEEIDAAAHWKRVFWFIGVPLIGLSAYNAYMLETEEWKHWEEHPPRTYPYPHLHIFNKKFPWGDGTKTAFHHDNNELMGGGTETRSAAYMGKMY